MPTKGNPRIILRLDPVLRAGLEAYALAKRLSLSELVRKVLMEFAREVSYNQKRVSYTLDRTEALVKTLEAQLFRVGIAGIETQKQREELYDTAMALLKEALKLAQSEEAAENAHARIEAMHLANTVNRTALAILTGYDRRDIEVLLGELKKTNESLQRQLRAGTEGTAADNGGSREKKAK